MTVEKYFETYLIEHGLFPHHAKAVMEDVKADKITQGVHWLDQMSGYPPQLIAVLTFTVRKAALSWSDTNMPKAFWRPMFDEKLLAEIKKDYYYRAQTDKA